MRNLVADLKPLHLLVVMKFFKEHGLGFQFRIFKYANVMSISSLVNKNNHVLFGDFEKKLTKKRITNIKDIMRKRNIFMLSILRSSENKYHFISPQIFDFYNTIFIGKELGIERNYLTLSAVRNEYILRISRKGRKEEPQLIKTFINYGADNINISRKHYKFLRIFYHMQDYITSDCNLKDGHFKCEKYRTTNL